jgi:hypothetical protein
MDEIFKQEFLTQKEVAELFRVSTNTIGNWEKRGFFSRWQAPGSTRVLYLSDEVRDFLDKNLKPRGEGSKPKQINGIKKERPVISSNRKWKV